VLCTVPTIFMSITARMLEREPPLYFLCQRNVTLVTSITRDPYTLEALMARGMPNIAMLSAQSIPVRPCRDLSIHVGDLLHSRVGGERSRGGNRSLKLERRPEFIASVTLSS
jgi:hypothetical protein